MVGAVRPIVVTPDAVPVSNPRSRGTGGRTLRLFLGRRGRAGLAVNARLRPAAHPSQVDGALLHWGGIAGNREPNG